MRIELYRREPDGAESRTMAEWNRRDDLVLWLEALRFLLAKRMAVELMPTRATVTTNTGKVRETWHAAQSA